MDDHRTDRTRRQRIGVTARWIVIVLCPIGLIMDWVDVGGFRWMQLAPLACWIFVLSTLIWDPFKPKKN